MNSTLCLFLLGAMINAQSEYGGEIPEGQVQEIDDMDNNIYTRKYRYDFKNLCPTTPPPAILTCEKHFRTGRMVSQMFFKDELPKDKLEKIMQLVQCKENKIPSIEASISIYCNMNGTLSEVEKLDFQSDTEVNLR